MLELKDIAAGYNKKPVLNGLSLKADKREIIAIIGPNGAGKSTVLKTVIGILRPKNGELLFKGTRINGNNPTLNIKSGIAYVPQGNTVFNGLTVLENLRMGGYPLTDKAVIDSRIQDVFALFPEIERRRNLDAANLSGGEKQMLALGRALMLRPELLLLDEPSLGLSPKAVTKSFEMIKSINSRFGTTMLIVEQNIKEALQIAGRVYVLVLGKVAEEAKPENLTKERIKELFLGGNKL